MAVSDVMETKQNLRNRKYGARNENLFGSGSKKAKSTWSKIKEQAAKEKAERLAKGLSEF